MKFDCGVMARLLEDFVASRFVMRHGVHGVPQFRERFVHPLARAALIAERAMLGDACATDCRRASWRTPFAPAN